MINSENGRLVGISLDRSSFARGQARRRERRALFEII